jgi:cytochrome c oxidase subunit 4
MTDPMTQKHPETAQHGHEHGGVAKYVYVFIALCVLTTASFFTYSDMWNNMISPDPRVKWAFMMAVSCTKALLVILFFMHVLWEANWKYVLTIPAAGMSIFLMLALVPDIGFRASHYSDERWRHAAEPRASASEHLPETEAGGDATGHATDAH